MITIKQVQIYSTMEWFWIYYKILQQYIWSCFKAFDLKIFIEENRRKLGEKRRYKRWKKKKEKKISKNIIQKVFWLKKMTFLWNDSSFSYSHWIDQKSTIRQDLKERHFRMSRTYNFLVLSPHLLILALFWRFWRFLVQCEEALIWKSELELRCQGERQWKMTTRLENKRL